jgi:hypothetical protein
MDGRAEEEPLQQKFEGLDQTTKNEGWYGDWRALSDLRVVPESLL